MNINIATSSDYTIAPDRKTVMTLHGYESNNTGTKIERLREIYNVINPKINFTEKNCYRNLVKLAEKYKPNIIVGSSMGGYLGYHLSNETSIPCLLFNPAMIETGSGNVKPTVETTNNNLSRKFVVTGLHDEVVNPVLLKEWLIRNANNAVILEENMGHRIPESVYFENVQKILMLLSCISYS